VADRAPQPSVAAGQVEAALDRRITDLAVPLSPAHVDPPLLLSREFLTRVEFFSSFPRRAVAAGRTGPVQPPATCYRLFQALQGTDLKEPLLATLTGPCFRKEARYDDGHLRVFTMREVVFIAPEDQVTEARDELGSASLRLAQDLGLGARLEEAEDPFFAESGRAKRLLQRLLRLKMELVAPALGGPLPLASFNLHQDFFGTRLGITLDGTPAWSGCAAWGIERWRLALEERWDKEPSAWPGSVRHTLGLDR
jgi:seryl-tRNA synthetase